MKTCVDLVDYCVDWMQSPKRPYWNKSDYLMWILSVNMLYGIEEHFLEDYRGESNERY